MSIITHAAYRLKYRRTKIIATLGPSSDSPVLIEKLIQAGVNVFRLNMSHGRRDLHAACFEHIRKIAEHLGRPIAIMIDLSGPKIRTGAFEGGHIELYDGDEVRVTIQDVIGRPGLISSQYKGLVQDVAIGSRILIDDGTIEIKVLAKGQDEVICKVVHGGIVKSHKGINLPGCTLSTPVLTEKDREDLSFALDLGADYVALSFVSQASDVEELARLITQKNGHAKIIAKMETLKGLEHAEAIIDAADGIMVARGDLGAELPPEEVPVAQDQLIHLAHKKMKPVIVATQMLESMVKRAKPTRAEVTDIAYAVCNGTDAIMLSAETASGEYPVEAVEMMDRIARETESHLWKEGKWGNPSMSTKEEPTMHEAISRASALLSRDLMARAIFVVSKSIKSSLAVSSSKPACPIVAITNDEIHYRAFALFWGVIPVFRSDAKSSEPIDLSRKMAVMLDLAKEGDTALVVRGFNKERKIDTPSITALIV